MMTKIVFVVEYHCLNIDAIAHQCKQMIFFYFHLAKSNTIVFEIYIQNLKMKWKEFESKFGLVLCKQYVG